MSSEINPNFPVLDRSAIIVEPTAAFLAWVKAMPGDPLEETLQDIQEDCSAYLIPEVRDHKAWLRKNYTPIFEQELISWCTDESLWPKDRSYKAFKKLFRVRFHSMVFDMARGPFYVLSDHSELEDIVAIEEVRDPVRNARVKEKALTLSVTLLGSDPPIWRRLEVLSTMTLGDLHYALQIAMGWTNSHLHEFEVKNKTYGVPHPDYDDYGKTVLDEDEVTVGEVLKRKGARCLYRYDFGDDWEHEVRVEASSKREKGVNYPRVVDGAMACPPEDSGGMYGYYRILDILDDPEDDEYEDYEEWMPPNFDPEAFDVKSANKEMKRIEQWRRWAEGEEMV